MILRTMESLVFPTMLLTGMSAMSEVSCAFFMQFQILRELGHSSLEVFQQFWIRLTLRSRSMV